MKQLIINKEKCVACGVCEVVCEQIVCDDLGYACIQESGIVEDESEIEKIIGICPQSAIEIVDYQSKMGIDSKEDLVYYIMNVVQGYKVSKLDDEKLIPPIYYNGSPACVYGQLDNDLPGKLFTSEAKATRAVRDEFYNNVTRKAKIIVRNLLSECKSGHFNKYRTFIKEEGNYYYDIIIECERLLKECEETCYVLMGIHLPEEMLKIHTEAIWREDSMGKRCSLDYLEDRLIDKALENGESASWYYDWLTVDGDEKMWSADSAAANEKYGEHIWKSIKEALSPKNIRPIVEDTIYQFNSALQEEMNRKGVEILSYISSINEQVGELLNVKDEWYNKCEEKFEKRNMQVRGIESLRVLLELDDIAEENVKSYSLDSYYGLELTTKNWNGKKVTKGQIIGTIAKGTHIHFRSANLGLPQPYGCGKEVGLKREYNVISPGNGVVHIFDEMVSQKRHCVGVIAHPDDNKAEIKKWYHEIKEKY